MLIRGEKGRFETFNYSENARFRVGFAEKACALTRRDYSLSAQTLRTKRFAAERREKAFETTKIVVDGCPGREISDKRNAWNMSRSWLSNCVIPSRWIWPPMEGAAHGKVLEEPPPIEVRGKEIKRMNPMACRF